MVKMGMNKYDLISMLNIIYGDVYSVLGDNSMLKLIVNNGYLASALADSLQEKVVKVTVDGKEFQCGATSLAPDHETIEDMLYSFVETLREDIEY
jgi:hypothetical protein